MNTPFVWTPEADAVLIAGRNAKLSEAEVAAKIKCSVRTVEARSRVLRKRGAEIWTGNSRSTKTPEKIAELRRLMEGGMTRKEAATSIHISDWTAERWLANPRRKKGAPPPPTDTDHPDEQSKSRWGLPAGHPVSWGAITRGTVLDGMGYPGWPTH